MHASKRCESVGTIGVGQAGRQGAVPLCRSCIAQGPPSPGTMATISCTGSPISFVSDGGSTYSLEYAVRRTYAAVTISISDASLDASDLEHLLSAVLQSDAPPVVQLKLDSVTVADQRLTWLGAVGSGSTMDGRELAGLRRLLGSPTRSAILTGPCCLPRRHLSRRAEQLHRHQQPVHRVWSAAEPRRAQRVGGDAGGRGARQPAGAGRRRRCRRRGRGAWLSSGHHGGAKPGGTLGNIFDSMGASAMCIRRSGEFRLWGEMARHRRWRCPAQVAAAGAVAVAGQAGAVASLGGTNYVKANLVTGAGFVATGSFAGAGAGADASGSGSITAE